MDTNEQLARKFGCNVEALRNVARLNAAEARKYEAIARGTGEKVRGYTADEWKQAASQSDRRSAE